MQSKGNAPTAAQVREMFDYDPITGILRWKIIPAKRTKIGDLAGTLKGNKYIRVSIKSNLYMVHRIIWLFVTGSWPDDHIDRNRTNNKWVNLRDVSQSVNQNNTGLRKTNTSGAKGINKIIQRGKVYWCARIHKDGKRINLGVRKDKQEAIKLRLEAENAA